MKAEELKPCPFCGSNRIGRQCIIDGVIVVGPRCLDCGATAGSEEAWNTGEEVHLDIAKSICYTALSVFLKR